MGVECATTDQYSQAYVAAQELDHNEYQSLRQLSSSKAGDVFEVQNTENQQKYVMNIINCYDKKKNPRACYQKDVFRIMKKINDIRGTHLPKFESISAKFAPV